MRIAFLVVDDRFDRPLPTPFFGSAPSALLEGFAMFAEKSEEMMAEGGGGERKTSRADGEGPGMGGEWRVASEGAREAECGNSELRNSIRDYSSAIAAKRIEVHVICCTKVALPTPEKLSENIWYHQIVLPHWTFLRSGHLGPILGVRKLLKRLEPDLVHAQGTERWCAISAALAPYPKVLTIHGNLRLINKVTPMEPKWYWKAQEFLETTAIPKFDGVVCITNYTQQNVSDLAKKTWVIPNAVDGSFFPLGEERVGELKSEKLKVESGKGEGRDEKEGSGELRGETASDAHPPLATRHPRPSTLPLPPIILVVAHIQSRKNQNAFIDAIVPLREKHQFRVRFFGRGAPTDEFGKGFFDRMEKHSWCSFEGMKGRDELREAFKSASLLVLPSLEDNCPMSVLEAMAAGVPVIASNVGGVPDLVTDGLNGLLCDPLSQVSMRSCVERIFSEPGLSHRLAAQAHRLAWERFHPTAIAKKHLEVYGEVIEGKKLKAERRN